MMLRCFHISILVLLLIAATLMLIMPTLDYYNGHQIKWYARMWSAIHPLRERWPMATIKLHNSKTILYPKAITVSPDDVSTKQRFPQAFLLGVARCGTGTLVTFLRRHPSLAIPNKTESWFYLRSAQYMKGEEWHLKKMPFSKPHQLTVECSPVYFERAIAMKRIVKRYPNAKFFVILRDPVDKVMSGYVHRIFKSNMSLSEQEVGFEKLIINEEGAVNEKCPDVHNSMYSEYAKAWLNLVPPERLHVVDGTQFAKNPLPELKRLEIFLGLPSYYTEDMFVFVKEKRFYCLKNKDGSPKCMKKKKGLRHPKIKKEVEDKLIAFFKPYNEELYKVIGRRLPWR